MEYMVWIGAAISALGLAGIIYSILLVRRARKTAENDEALRQEIAKVVPINLGALFVSVLGLMCVAIGVFLS